MLNFEDVDKIQYYHTLSNVLYLLAPITGGITLIPAVIVDAKLDEVLDIAQDKDDIKNRMVESVKNFINTFENHEK